MTRAAGLAAALSLLGGAAGAASVTFGDYTSGDSVLVLPEITAHDDVAGKITVSINIDANSPETGLLTGIFLDFAELDAQAMTVPVTVAGFANATRNLRSGVNLNGATSDDFDVGFRFDPAHPDVAPNGGVAVDEAPFAPFTFHFAHGGLALENLTRIGLRWQSVTTDGQGDGDSDKVLGTPLASVIDPPAVPLPPAVALLLSGLAGLAWAARRRPA